MHGQVVGGEGILRLRAAMDSVLHEGVHGKAAGDLVVRRIEVEAPPSSPAPVLPSTHFHLATRSICEW